jgi:PKHD-type hydroxylase
MQIQCPYWFFKSALNDEQCATIRELGMNKINENLKNGVDVSAKTLGDTDKSNRPDALAKNDLTAEQVLQQSQITNIYDRDSYVSWLSDRWLYDLVHPYVHQANKCAGWNWEWDYTEPAQFTMYKENGFYSWHQDGGFDSHHAYKRYIHGVTDIPLKPDGRLPPLYTRTDKMVGKIRKISVTINLCDEEEYDGGNLMFDFGEHAETKRYHECTEIRPKGSIIVFPSFLYHCVTPVTRGTRFSLVMWNLGRPFK